MAHFAIQMADGSVAIMQTVGDAQVEDCLAKWPAKESARVMRRMAIDPATIPADRTFRNAWILADGAIAHDMAKAREIKRDQLRRERAPLLAALDTAYLRADETKDEAAKAAIGEQKQRLREAPGDPAIDAAKTADELKAITLAGLAASAVAAAEDAARAV
jgi:hypothetical protein